MWGMSTFREISEINKAMSVEMPTTFEKNEISNLDGFHLVCYFILVWLDLFIHNLFMFVEEAFTINRVSKM